MRLAIITIVAVQIPERDSETRGSGTFKEGAKLTFPRVAVALTLQSVTVGWEKSEQGVYFDAFDTIKLDDLE